MKCPNKSGKKGNLLRVKILIQTILGRDIIQQGNTYKSKNKTQQESTEQNRKTVAGTAQGERDKESCCFHREQKQSMKVIAINYTSVTLRYSFVGDTCTRRTLIYV